MWRQYIYTIERLTKKHGQREVLKDIWLAFYPGAKIGVLGRNGSGKSTLLQIMAGGDKKFDCEARLTDGFTRGFLSQEPQLTPGTAWDNLQEAIKLLLNKPDLLLLDEPTNHLDAEAVNWLEHTLAEYPGTVVAVTHDRYFLDNVAQWILELDRGMGMPFEGNYSSWLEQKQARLQREERQSEAKQKTLERELEWIRMSPRARQAKSKARIAAYEKLSSERFEERPDEFEIQIPPGKHLGDLVVETVNLRNGYGDRLLIYNL